mgnify:CR=1 FL=1
MSTQVLVVDGDASAPRAADRPVVDVAVGILIAPDGAFLLTSRPVGKVYAGYWEFPGGKLEAGETVEQALRRELQEEIGVTIGSAAIWKVSVVDYPHGLVRLHFCKVFDWTGEFDMREALVTIRSEAGGVDAADWAEMLLRMYSAWAAKHEFAIELLDRQDDEVAGPLHLRDPLAHHPPQLLGWHHAVHGLLHLRVSVLNAKADPVKSQITQMQHVIATEEFRIDFDGCIEVGIEVEVLLQ